MKAKFVFENVSFERGQDPKTAMGLGLMTKFDEFAKNALMKRTELDEEDIDIFANDEVFGKWRQFQNGKWYAGYLVLYRDGDDNKLHTYINSDYDEDVYPLDIFLDKLAWIYHFNS